MAAPPLLVAARQKFLTSTQYAALSAAHKIGTRQDVLGAPAQWVTVGVDSNGLPHHYGEDRAAVSFHLRGASWTSSENSARFPKVGVTVWVAGEVGKPNAEWLAYDVAATVIDVFDDPAGEAPPTWGPSIYVTRCRWDGELAVSDVEDMPTLWRADVAFNLEVV